MHDSLIGLSRALFGPGKRGSLSPSKASQSNVTIGKDCAGQIGLSYLALGTPHSIAHCYRSGNEIRFCVDSQQGVDGFEEFIDNLKKYKGQYKLLVDSMIPAEHILLGCHKGKYYVGTSSKDIDSSRIQKEISFVIAKYKLGEINRNNSQTRLSMTLAEEPNISRVYAKTAINVLARVCGRNYVVSDEFRQIKQWIVGESLESNFYHLPSIEINNPLDLPDRCHWCIIGSRENELFATVCFYNTFYRNFRLSNVKPQVEFLDGMICNWQSTDEKKEFTLSEWIFQVSLGKMDTV